MLKYQHNKIFVTLCNVRKINSQCSEKILQYVALFNLYLASNFYN